MLIFFSTSLQINITH